MDEADKQSKAFNKTKLKSVRDKLIVLRDMESQLREIETIIMPHIDEREVERLTKLRDVKLRHWNKCVDVLIDMPDVSIEATELTIAINNLEAEVVEFKIKITDYHNQDGNKECSLCGQVITNKHINKECAYLSEQITNRTNSIHETRIKLKYLLKQVANRKATEENCEQIERIYLKAEDELKEAKHQRELRQERIDRMLDLERRTITGSMEVITACTIQNYTPDIKHYDDMIKLQTQKLRCMHEHIDDLDMKKEYVQFWVDGFSNKGIKADIIDSVIPYLNERVGRYADILTDGEIEVSFENVKRLKSGELRDALEISCGRRSGGTTYKGISEGEKKRVDLCQALALRDLVASRGSQSLEFMFLDECFEALDSIGVDRVVTLLEELHKKCKCIYVSTHISELKGNFDDSITVINEKGISSIV